MFPLINIFVEGCPSFFQSFEFLVELPAINPENAILYFLLVLSVSYSGIGLDARLLESLYLP